MVNIDLQDSNFNIGGVLMIGVGGGGCNAINRMIDEGVTGVSFIAINTDIQSLNQNKAERKIQIGTQLTNGLGAGADPSIGEQAAHESKDVIQEALKESNVVFITAGMGGGTGTGAAPVIAQLAKEMGILTIVVVTKPFLFEGKVRMKNAISGIKTLENKVDTTLIISNQKLIEGLAEDNFSLLGAFLKVDEVLKNSVLGITEVIQKTGIVNVDFADVRNIMKDSGVALMGLGIGFGEDRATKAIEMAVFNPLISQDLSGAKGILINISGDKSLTLNEYHQIIEHIRSQVHEDANIIAGALIDDELKESLKITLIATHFEENKASDHYLENVVTENEKNDQLQDKLTHYLKKNITLKDQKKQNNSEGLYEKILANRKVNEKNNRGVTRSKINHILNKEIERFANGEDIPSYQRKVNL